MMINTENMDNDIMFLAKSEIRLKILTELKIKPQSIKDIVNKTNITYSSVTSNLSKLECNNHVLKKDHIYELTPMTRIYFDHLMEFKKSVDIIRNFNSFWHMHNIDHINNECIQNINDLYESKLIETNPIDIYKTHNAVKKQLKECKNVKAIFPYVHPEYPQLLERILLRKGKIELILHKNLYRGILFDIDKGLRQDSIKNGNLKVHVIRSELDIYLAICDNHMNLGLFKNDGSYDQNRILSSEDDDSLKWANNLFETIKESVI